MLWWIQNIMYIVNEHLHLNCKITTEDSIASADMNNTSNNFI